VVLDVFHQHRDLRLESRRIAWQFGEFHQKILHLAMLFDALTDDLLQFLVAVFEKVRIEDRFFDVRVNVKLFLDLLEGRRVIPVFVRLYLFE
jgi:hypothetical protein